MFGSGDKKKALQEIDNTRSTIKLCVTRWIEHHAKAYSNQVHNHFHQLKLIEGCVKLSKNKTTLLLKCKDIQFIGNVAV